MLRAGTAKGSQVIYPCATGYFVIFSSKDSVFANDFHAIDEFEAVTKAFEIWLGELNSCPWLSSSWKSPF